jgi:hypothetical protein
MTSNGKETRKAFLSGFARGLSGAALLYTTPAVPAPAQMTIQPIRRAFENESDAIKSDWVAVGSDLDISIKKYAEAR